MKYDTVKIFNDHEKRERDEVRGQKTGFLLPLISLRTISKTKQNFYCRDDIETK